MIQPKISDYMKDRKPSAVRVAQLIFAKRTDNIDAVNVAIGNVSLPMHKAMRKRMNNLVSSESPFSKGVVKYSNTIGMQETRDAFLHVLEASGLSTTGLYTQITDGGSQAMELVILGTTGKSDGKDKPLLLLDAAYTNYVAIAKRVGRKTVSVTRTLNDDGVFSLPDVAEVEAVIKKEQPSAIVVIPYDNPTGQLISRKSFVELAKLAVKYNLWIISDEAYRELAYKSDEVTSIWAISEQEVPGITGRRISIETTSKVWNACGLRIGALVTDSFELHEKEVAENTASLCSNVIGQYIFAALNDVSSADLQKWFKKQRNYYSKMVHSFRKDMLRELPNVIVSQPEASIYSVIDVRNLADDTFEASDFVAFCASKGIAEVDGKKYTLLVSPMRGFYNIAGKENPGRTQMRVAFVETPERMALVPKLFAELFQQYTTNF